MLILSKTNHLFIEYSFYVLGTSKQISDPNERQMILLPFSVELWKVQKTAKAKTLRNLNQIYFTHKHKQPLNFFALWAYSISVLNPSNFVCLCVCFVNSQLIWSVILLEAILITTSAHNTRYTPLVLFSCLTFWSTMICQQMCDLSNI